MEQPKSDKLVIRQLIPAFRKKFMGEGNIRWCWNRLFRSSKDPEPIDVHVDLIDRFFEEHFAGKVTKYDYFVQGSLSLRGVFANQTVKWVCFDLDSTKATEIFRRDFIPILRKAKINFFWEHSGRADGEFLKAHIWIFTEDGTEFDRLKFLVNLLLKEAGLSDWRTRPELKRKVEIFPLYKPNNAMRLWGGPHLRNDDFAVNPVEVNLDGNKLWLPRQQIEAFIEIKQLTQKKIEKLIGVLQGKHPDEKKPFNPEEASEDGPLRFYGRVKESGRKEVMFRPVGLSMPAGKCAKHRKIHEMPEGKIHPFVQKILANCPAFNSLVYDAVVNHSLNEDGRHEDGLAIASLFKYPDLVIDEGGTYQSRDYGRYFFSQTRQRQMKKHQWFWESADETSTIPSCETMEDKFDLCKGCPQRGRSDFTHPAQFYYSKELVEKPVEHKPIKDYIAADNQQIREAVLEPMKAEFMKALRAGKQIARLVKAPTGCGKSHAADELLAQASKAGYPCMLSVASGKLAIEHVHRLAQFSVGAHVVMGFENTMKYLSPHKCPDHKAIVKKLEAFSSREQIKAEFCIRCPYRDCCDYPGQFSDIKDLPQNKVLIIQHAHLSSAESMNQIYKRRHSLMVFDEDVYPYLIKQVTAGRNEFSALMFLKRDYAWAAELLDWISSSKRKLGGGRISPNPEELMLIKKQFDAALIGWNLPQLIRAYNSGRSYKEAIGGSFSFTPLPSYGDRPSHLILDATMSAYIAKKLTPLEDFGVIGANYLNNPKAFDSRNEVIKVLDASGSKTSYRHGERLTKILDFIAFKARTTYKKMTSLVVVFKDIEAEARRYFKEKHGDVEHRIEISHMSVGRNDWEFVNVHYILTGVYMVGGDLEREAWRLRAVEEYWEDNDPNIDDPYPLHDQDTGYSKLKTSVKYLMLKGDNVQKLKTSLYYKTPKDFHMYKAARSLVASIEQANRARFKRASEIKQKSMKLHGYVGSNRKNSSFRAIYFWTNLYLPRTIFTRVALEDELFAEMEI